MSIETKMTHEQRLAVLDRVRDVLGEHATAYVVILELPGDEEGETNLCHTWDGGFTVATGLVRRMADHLQRRDAQANEEAEE